MGIDFITLTAWDGDEGFPLHLAPAHITAVWKAGPRDLTRIATTEGVSQDWQPWRVRETPEEVLALIAKAEERPVDAAHIEAPTPAEVAADWERRTAGLTCRARNTLHALGVDTVRKAKALTNRTLRGVPNCGAVTIDEILRAVDNWTGEEGEVRRG